MLQKYTSFIPSATYKVEPDISLFDHLKTTSALATCLYIYENEEHKNPLPFLIIGGDISGVQNFIYRIAKAQGVGGIAKRLRGRSFYLFLLQETVAKYIIYKTGLLIPNVLYSGGGRFELLLPNTQKVKKILEETKYEINKWLFEQYGGEIGLILEEIEASEDDLKNYNTLLIRLDEKLSRGKRKKYFSLMKEDSFWVENPQPHIKICKVCGISEVKNDIPCEVCEKHKEIGARLPFTEYILFTSSKDTTIDGLEVSFEKFGSVYLIEKGKFKEEWLKSENLIEAEKIIQEKEIDIIKSNIQFIANIVPIATESFSIKEEGVEEDIKVEKGHVLSFEILADASIGDKKIGLLKMDVDNLGLIFGRGIKEKSISRVSTLSRLMTTFFCGYINQICHELFLQWKKDKNNLWEHKDKVEEIFYIVYAGGDDLLIIGPSSEIPKLALKIRDEFKEYTCDNPDITISAGIFFCKPKYPVSLAAKGVTESLEKSKKDKNSITIFDDTVSWEKYKELLEFGESLFQHTQEEKIPRGFLYKVLMIHKQYKKGEDYNYIPMFLYFLSRNIKVKEIIEEIKEKGIKEFKYIKLPVNYALLKSRKEGGKK
jgi:CRISPR-associated protein Csm1